MKQYIIDAFTDRVFHGNPAAVCVMDSWPDEQLMKNMALENNLSETAFIVKEPEGYHLRWFTPACEVGLCGHATLASGFCILNFFDKQAQSVAFNTLAGRLTVTRKGGLYEMEFPNIPLQRLEVTGDIIEALGTEPQEVWMGKDLDMICVFGDERQVVEYVPDFTALARVPVRMVHITAPGSNGFDCNSRCFGPNVGVPEDPVCGSAHCQIVPYWAARLGKKVIDAWESSPRGGSLQGEIINDERLLLRGNAVLYAESSVNPVIE